jgi:hypothetical protein
VIKALPQASRDLDDAIRAVIEAKRAEVAAWEWLADVHVDVRREADAGRGMYHTLMVSYWNVSNALQAADKASDHAVAVWILATTDYRKALVLAAPVTPPSTIAPASWTPDERHEWEESIAKIDGVTIVDVDDWCQAKDKPVAERAGVEGRAKMLAYFTSTKGGDSVRAYIAQKGKP